MTDPESDEPIIHEPEPEKVDAALFERVLLFPRLKPATAEPGPSGVAPLTDEAPGKGWEAIPDDGQDFAAAWAATKERRAREAEGPGDAAPAVEARVEQATSSSEPESAWVKPEPDEVPFVAEAGPVAAPSAAPVATPAPAMAARGTPAIRLVVAVEEATKMAQQLAREWTASGVAPSIEDIVVRAVARALPGGQRATDSDGVALWVLRDEKDTRHVLREAGRRPFKEAVETLARLVHANLGDDACRASVTSLAAFGVDEGTVEPGNGESLAVCLGATRSVPAVEGDHVTERQVATLTIGWDPERVSMAAAARFSARVRELLEAPYVLLAD